MRVFFAVLTALVLAFHTAELRAADTWRELQRTLGSDGMAKLSEVAKGDPEGAVRKAEFQERLARLQGDLYNAQENAMQQIGSEGLNSTAQELREIHGQI